jgi:hypothetical protein
MPTDGAQGAIGGASFQFRPCYTPVMNVKAPPTGYIPVHIVLFREEGEIYARWPQTGFVTHGESEAQAIVRLLNMAFASLTEAHSMGFLPAALEKAGLRIVQRPISPEAEGLDVYLPVWTDAPVKHAN